MSPASYSSHSAIMTEDEKSWEDHGCFCVVSDHISITGISTVVVVRSGESADDACSACASSHIIENTSFAIPVWSLCHLSAIEVQHLPPIIIPHNHSTSHPMP